MVQTASKCLVCICLGTNAHTTRPNWAPCFAGKTAANSMGPTALLELPPDVAALIVCKLTKTAARSLAASSTACMSLVLDVRPDVSLRVDLALARIVARLPVDGHPSAKQRSSVRMECVLPGPDSHMFRVCFTWRGAVLACAAICETGTRTHSGARFVLPAAALPLVREVVCLSGLERELTSLPEGMATLRKIFQSSRCRVAAKFPCACKQRCQREGAVCFELGHTAGSRGHAKPDAAARGSLPRPGSS